MLDGKRGVKSLRALLLITGMCAAIVLWLTLRSVRSNSMSVPATGATSATSARGRASEDSLAIDATQDVAPALGNAPVASPSLNQPLPVATVAPSVVQAVERSPYHIRGTVSERGGAKLRRYEGIHSFHYSSVRADRVFDQDDPRYYRSTDDDHRSVHIDADGHYSISIPEPGIWNCEVSQFGYAAQSMRVNVSGLQPDMLVDFALDPYPVMRTRIEIDYGSEPCNRGGGGGSDGSLSFFADPQGTKSIELWCVVSRGPLSSDRAGFFQSLRDRSLTGSGAALISDETDPFVTCIDHRAVVTMLHELHDSLPVYVSLVHGRTILASCVAREVSSTIVLKTSMRAILDDSASLRVRVVDAETGVPLMQAMAQLRSSGDWIPDTTPVVVDALKGAIVCEQVPPGELRLEVQSSGHEPWERVLDLAPGAKLDLGDIALGHARTIRGQFVDAAGKPCRVHFSWFRKRDAGFERGALVATSSLTGSDGLFFIEDLARDNYVILAGIEGYLDGSPVVVNTREGSVDGLRIELRDPTDVTVRIDHLPAEPVLLQLTDRSNTIIFEQLVWTGMELTNRSTRPSRDITWNLVPGEYSVYLTSRRITTHERDFEVGAEPLELVLDL